MSSRTVCTRWSGGMRAVSDLGGFEIVVDEPESSGGTGTGPQPTDLLLASVSSCITLAVAWVARKRGVELGELDVRVVGTYAGPRFERIEVSVSSTTPSLLGDLMEEVERVCYVSNTLRNAPELSVRVV